MSSEISGISEEIFFRSLSKRMDGEIHESDECRVAERYGELNENGRIVVVFIRICQCRNKISKESILNYDYEDYEGRLNLPETGVEVHKNEACEYVSEQDFDDKNKKIIYRFRLECHCAGSKGIKRPLDYN